jgi:hypothetical protein
MRHCHTSLPPLTGLRSARSVLPRAGDTGRMLQRLHCAPFLTLRSLSTRCYPDTRNLEPLAWVRRSPDFGGNYQPLVLRAHPVGKFAPSRRNRCAKISSSTSKPSTPGGWLPLPVAIPAPYIEIPPTARVRLPPRGIPTVPSSTSRTPSESETTA